MNFKIPARLTSFQNPIISIRFNILQVYPSVLNFVLALLLISNSFNVLSDYFYVSLGLLAAHTSVRIVIKLVTQLL